MNAHGTVYSYPEKKDAVNHRKVGRAAPLVPPPIYPLKASVALQRACTPRKKAEHPQEGTATPQMCDLTRAVWPCVLGAAPHVLGMKGTEAGTIG